MGETRRIYASETELSISATNAQTGKVSQFQGGYALLKGHTHPEVIRFGDMQSNGAKFYVDVGSHLEYATPEDTTIDDGVVLNQTAGDLFVIDSLIRHLRQGTMHKKLILSRRVIDDGNTTWGYHMNLSADRTKIPELTDTYLHLLGLAIATGQLLTGAGMIRQSGGKSYYSLSQKITDITRDYDSGTQTNKPLINQRDEPHDGGVNDLLRIHLVSKDQNISDWATGMSFGMVSLVLRAIEQGKHDSLRLDDYPPGDNVELARLAMQNSYDASLTHVSDDVVGALLARKTRYTDGNEYNALEAQKKIIEIVEKTEHTDEEARKLEQWKIAISDLERDPMLLTDRSDAIARLALLRATAERLATNEWSDDGLKKTDHAFGQTAIITKEDADDGKLTALDIYKQSPVYKLRKRQFTTTKHPDDETLLDRMVNAPTTTRAAIRSHYLLSSNQTLESMNWGKVKTIESGERDLPPFDNRIPA
jgi:proteasome accessory factor A